MLSEMSSEEFDGWAAFFALEPWGGHGDDLRAAAVALAALTPHLKPGKRLGPGDVIPRLRPPPTELPSEEEEVRWLAWVVSQGGRVVVENQEAQGGSIDRNDGSEADS